MKNKIIQLLLLICCLPALTGCIREEEYANDPVGNFEQLWKIIDEQYCFLEAKGIDWDAVHEKYRKLVVPTMSNDDLFDLLSQMLYTLKDGHVNLSSAKRTSFYDEWYQGYDWNYREDILYQTYLGSASSGYYTAAGLKYKIFDNNIGYIRYESFSAGVGNGNLDEVLLYLSPCNGLIIDVRDNGGGNLTNSTRIAARFTNQKTLTGYIQHKTGPGHNDFSQMDLSGTVQQYPVAEKGSDINQPSLLQRNKRFCQCDAQHRRYRNYPVGRPDRRWFRSSVLVRTAERLEHPLLRQPAFR